MNDINLLLELGALLGVSVIVFWVMNILVKEIRCAVWENKGQFNMIGHRLDRYYRDYSQNKYVYGKKHFKFDKNGIPLSKGYSDNGKYYNPIFISQFALGAHQHCLNTDDNDSKISMLKCADWLEANLKIYEEYYYWEFNFNNPSFPRGALKVPYVSSMAQGQGTSVLLRAFSLTGNDKYLEAAKKAIEPVFHDISKGGISLVDGDTYIFPQEFPTNPPSNILNGAIYTFLGVYDFYILTGDPYMKKYCDIIINSIANKLENYDTGYWSLYCTWPKWLASPRYNLLHVNQLRFLYLITNNKKFLDYSEKFEAYQKNWKNRTKYVLGNNVRRLKEFTIDDLRKIPNYLKKPLKFR